MGINAAEHERTLHLLAGCWSGEEILEPSPWDRDDDRATARFELHLELGGRILVAEYLEARSGRICYRAHGVLGWDETRACFFLQWFDDAGQSTAMEPALGRCEGQRLILERTSPTHREQYTFTLEEQDRFAFRRESARADEPAAIVVEADLAREAEAVTAPSPERADQACPYRGICPAMQMLLLGERAHL